MLIPDEVRKCVAYIGYRLPDGDMAFAGTVFFVGRSIEGTDQNFIYLITAKHVIQGIESKSTDGKVLIRVNYKDENAYTIESDLDEWMFHPEETEVDVAVRPHATLPKEADISVIPLSMFLNENVKKETEFSLGEEVFFTGLFYNHHGRRRNIPIVRIGNIIALPEEKVLTGMGFIDAYLIEARSIGGISGSPVFVNFGITRILEGKLKHFDSKYGSYHLLGLMHGHWDVHVLNKDSISQEERKKEIVNMGIAIVVPVEKILEVINQPSIQEEEKIFESALRVGVAHPNNTD